MGIAEQNMVSVAAGLSLTGKIPFAHSFSVFIVGRAYDQIRQSIAVPKLNVKLVDLAMACRILEMGRHISLWKMWQ